jgi:hypothetical protein
MGLTFHESGSLLKSETSLCLALLDVWNLLVMQPLYPDIEAFLYCHTSCSLRTCADKFKGACALFRNECRCKSFFLSAGFEKSGITGCTVLARLECQEVAMALLQRALVL